MKIFFFILALAGVVWGIQPHISKNEEVTIYLRPGESKVIQLKTVDDNQIVTEPLVTLKEKIPTDIEASLLHTTTTNPPHKENSVPIDLTQRLFYANHEDSDSRRKTLDLSGLELTGGDVMNILHSLNETVLTSIRRLDLSHNRVMSLPAKFWPMQMEYSLLELRLDHNHLYLYDSMNLRSTRFELRRLLSLKKLSMAHCGLTTHVSTAQLEFPPIETLDLSYNKLIDVPSGLSTVVSLENLNLSHNNIAYLNSGRLSSLDYLRTLDLSHNQMIKMFDDPLQQLARLETLYLDHNNLTETPKLYEYTGSYQPRITLTLSGNPFTCGSALGAFLDTERIYVVDQSNVTCLDSYRVELPLANTTENSYSRRWEAVKENFSGARRWVRENLPHWDTIFDSLGWFLWLMFGVLLGLIYTHRRATKTSPPPDVPYNVLTDGALY